MLTTSSEPIRTEPGRERTASVYMRASVGDWIHRRGHDACPRHRVNLPALCSLGLLPCGHEISALMWDPGTADPFGPRFQPPGNLPPGDKQDSRKRKSERQGVEQRTHHQVANQISTTGSISRMTSTGFPVRPATSAGASGRKRLSVFGAAAGLTSCGVRPPPKWPTTSAPGRQRN
jgi:hypothetical protein